MNLLSIFHHSFVRFLLVGILNTLIGLSSIFLLLNVLGLNYWASTFIGNGLGAIVSYFLNRTFTFQSQASLRGSFLKFVFVILVCYAFSYALSFFLGHFLSRTLHWNGKMAENVAVLIGSGFYTISNYLGHRFFTFKSN